MWSSSRRKRIRWERDFSSQWSVILVLGGGIGRGVDIMVLLGVDVGEVLVLVVRGGVEVVVGRIEGVASVG